MNAQHDIPLGLLARLGNAELAREEVDLLVPFLEGTPLETPDWFITRARTIVGPRSSAARGNVLPTGISTLRTKFTVARAFVGEATDALLRGSALQTGLVPVRQSPSTPHRMIWEEQGVAFIMEVRDDGYGTAAVTGQVLHAGTERGFVVELWEDRGTAPLVTLELPPLGYFVVPRLPHGAYVLALRPLDANPALGSTCRNPAVAEG